MSRPLSAGENLVVPQDCRAGEHFKQTHTQPAQHGGFVEPRRTSGEAARKIILAVSLPLSAFVTQANAHPPHSCLQGSTLDRPKRYCWQAIICSDLISSKPINNVMFSVHTRQRNIKKSPVFKFRTIWERILILIVVFSFHL